MKKLLLVLALITSVHFKAQSQTTKPVAKTETAPAESNLNFSFYIVSVHQLIRSAMNYNNQPEIFAAFMERAGFYLQGIDIILSKNKESLTKKLLPLKLEDVQNLITNYKQFTEKLTLSENEMMSANLWLKIAETQNKKIVTNLNR